jgi:hypothetical protein
VGFAFKHPQHGDILGQDLLDAAVISLGLLRLTAMAAFENRLSISGLT